MPGTDGREQSGPPHFLPLPFLPAAGLWGPSYPEGSLGLGRMYISSSRVQETCHRLEE